MEMWHQSSTEHQNNINGNMKVSKNCNYCFSRIDDICIEFINNMLSI